MRHHYVLTTLVLSWLLGPVSSLAAEPTYEATVPPLHREALRGLPRSRGAGVGSAARSTSGGTVERRPAERPGRRCSRGSGRARCRPGTSRVRRWTTWRPSSSWIDGDCARKPAGSRAEGRVVLRRLNRAQYENTVRDLLAVDINLKDLLPEDTPAYGFDTVAERSDFTCSHGKLSGSGRCRARGGDLPQPASGEHDPAVPIPRRAMAVRNPNLYLIRDDAVVLFNPGPRCDSVAEVPAQRAAAGTGSGSRPTHTRQTGRSHSRFMGATSRAGKASRT